MRIQEDTLVTLLSCKRLNHRGPLSIVVSAGKFDIDGKVIAK